MFLTMLIIFILGYLAIALEHPLKIDKAASALIIGTLCWVAYIIGGNEILQLGHSPSWELFKQSHTITNLKDSIQEFIVHKEIVHHLGETAEILFFLLGAMTIVEMIDQHDGFQIITDKITSKKKVTLLWILALLTFFMSALLDNLTTTIVFVALLRKLISDKETRWLFASVIILSANAGGAWSPIGDVTTIMLWLGGQVTAAHIMLHIFIPSLISLLIPLAIFSFTIKGNINRPTESNNGQSLTTPKEQRTLLITGIIGLLAVPAFKTFTHLPPYMGMLLVLGIIWIISELIHKDKPHEIKKQLSVSSVLSNVDVPTILFFLGILSAVAALQSAGHLNVLAQYLDKHLGNVYLIDLAIGILSAVVDNVPLVAGAMGMYPIADPAATGYLANFVQNGSFWDFLAYTAGTGGSILIIGSAAGVAAMGIEKIDFIWYIKRISLVALIGYLAGAGAYYMLLGL